VRHLVVAIAVGRVAGIVYIIEVIANAAASSIACDIVELAIAYLRLERVPAYAYASTSMR